jgi:hypothetical protein
MLARPQVLFLQEKIMELKQALFINTSEAVLRLPVSVVNALQVDDVGQVWFLVSRPKQNINEFDNNIPGKLEFYKKGSSFYLHVWGQATLVTDPEEVNNVTGISGEIRQAALSQMILVRMKITHIHYYPYPQLRVAKNKEPFRIQWQPSGLIKTLQYVIKDIIPVFQSH